MRDFFDKLVGREDDEIIVNLDVDDEVEPVKTTDAAMLERHKQTLVAVDRVLTDAQRRVAAAIDDTGTALEQRHRHA